MAMKRTPRPPLSKLVSDLMDADETLQQIGLSMDKALLNDAINDQAYNAMILEEQNACDTAADLIEQICEQPADTLEEIKLKLDAWKTVAEVAPCDADLKPTDAIVPTVRKDVADLINEAASDTGPQIVPRAMDG